MTVHAILHNRCQSVRHARRPCHILLCITLLSLILTACQPVTPGAADENQPLPAQTAATDAPPTELTPVPVGVGFVPNVQFAPFYVGMEQDIFAAEGLDLRLDYGFENDYLALVGTDEMQFMIGSGDQVVLGRAQGLPVRYVMNWYTQYPVVIFAKADAGIEQPADLAGKSVGIPGPFGANYVALRGILEAAGMSEAEINLETIGFTQPAAVSADTVDAAVDYAVNGPIILQQEGITVTQIELDEHLRIPANGLVTNENTLRNDPELVERLVRALTHAIQYTLDNPDAAFEIALQFVPEAGGENRAANRAVFDASLAYWTPQPDRRLGETTRAEWQAVAELMERIGLVDTVVPAAELFTNEFLPENAE